MKESLDTQQTPLLLLPHLGYNLLRGHDGVDEGCGWLSTALGYGTGAVDNHVLLNASGEVFPPTGLSGHKRRFRSDLTRAVWPWKPSRPSRGCIKPHKSQGSAQKHKRGNRQIRGWRIITKKWTEKEECISTEKSPDNTFRQRIAAPSRQQQFPVK